MAKELSFGVDAREKLVKGVDAVASAVAASLGPKGRNVIITKQYGCPQIVNDGVTIAKEIELKDPLENAGAQLLKEVASKTNDAAGDGTSTASVLTQSIVHEGLQHLDSGKNPVIIKQGINKAVEDVIEFIKTQAVVSLDESLLQQVATVSAGNNEEIGKLIAEAIKAVGDDGVVTVEESNTFGTTLKLADGMQLDKGYISPYFITDPERMEAVLDHPYVLCVNKKINLVSDIVPILEQVARDGKSLLLIAEDIEGEALAAIVVNVMRKTLRCAAIKAPGFGDKKQQIMEDVAVLTGGTMWTEELGTPLEHLMLNTFCGTASRVVVGKEDTTIVVPEQNKEMIKEHINRLKQQVVQEKSDYEKEKLQQRIARLAGGVAVIKVGAASEVELKEQKLRIEDALNATKAAKEEGIVAGGGYTLLRAQDYITQNKLLTMDPSTDLAIGYKILVNALSLPLKQIAKNAGADANIVVATCHQKQLGYNALTDVYEDLMVAGVVDPAKVTRCALQNAASVAGMLLTTEAAIVDIPNENNESAFAGRPPMPMM